MEKASTLTPVPVEDGCTQDSAAHQTILCSSGANVPPDPSKSDDNETARLFAGGPATTISDAALKFNRGPVSHEI